MKSERKKRKLKNNCKKKKSLFNRKKFQIHYKVCMTLMGLKDSFKTLKIKI